jgi:site-specific recombinase XerD
VLQQAFQHCGLQGALGMHAMRKTFAMRFYQQSQRDLLKTQKALGHKWITTTQRYLHVDEADIEALILAM